LHVLHRKKKLKFLNVTDIFPYNLINFHLSRALYLSTAKGTTHKHCKTFPNKAALLQLKGCNPVGGNVW